MILSSFAALNAILELMTPVFVSLGQTSSNPQTCISNSIFNTSTWMSNQHLNLNTTKMELLSPPHTHSQPFPSQLMVTSSFQLFMPKSLDYIFSLIPYIQSIKKLDLPSRYSQNLTTSHYSHCYHLGQSQGQIMPALCPKHSKVLLLHLELKSKSW